MKMIETNLKSRKPLRCPVVGCNNKDPILKVTQTSHVKGGRLFLDAIVQAHLYTDPEVQRKVAKQRKR